jgi:hypothetical protein
MIDALNLKHDPYPSKREAVGMKRPTVLRVLILAVIIVVGVSMPTFRVQGAEYQLQSAPWPCRAVRLNSEALELEIESPSEGL